MTAGELVAAYEENEVRAKLEWLGKAVDVSGRVHSIDEDILGNSIVRLAGPNEFQGVVCTMRDAASAAQLDRGQQVTLTGRVDDKVVLVRLRDCF